MQILAAVLVVAMTATTFLTQRQLMSKNMPADAMTGQYAQQQKMLLYVLPVVFAVGGIAFPIGVLFYWTTSNLWTMCQQFYVIRNNPAPGHAGRQGQAGPGRGEAQAQGPARPGDPDRAGPRPRTRLPRRRQRQQPKKQTRSQRKKQPPGRRQAAAGDRRARRTGAEPDERRRAGPQQRLTPPVPRGAEPPNSADPARPTGSTA